MSLLPGVVTATTASEPDERPKALETVAGLEVAGVGDEAHGLLARELVLELGRRGAAPDPSVRPR